MFLANRLVRAREPVRQQPNESFSFLTVLQLAQCTLDIVSHLHRCENFVHWLSLARTAGGESSTSRFNLTKPIEIRVLPPGRSLDFISEKPKVRSLVWI